MSKSGNVGLQPAQTTQAKLPWAEIRWQYGGPVLLIVALFSLATLSRLPFRSQFLYHWDSVNFALAVERFDLSTGQPHPPGYLLYVVVARLANLLIASPPDTLVLISVVSSGLSAAAMFWLGRALYGRTTGLIAALFLTASPLFWFYGEVALPHTLDTCMVIFSAYLLYRLWSGQRAYLYPSALALAVAGGFRPQTLAFLAPLAALAATRVPWADRLKAAGVLAVLCMVWLAPLVWLAGGLDRYRELTAAFSASFRYFEATTLLLQGNASGLLYSLDKLARYTAFAWGAAVVPLLIYSCSAPRRARDALHSRSAVFLTAWALPSLLFYVFVHMGQQGLVFVFLPALLLVSAEATRRLGELFVAAHRPVSIAVTLILALNAAIFLFAPQFLLPGNRFKVLSWDTIRASDAYYAALIDSIRARFPASQTLLVGADWRHASYYLPEYRLIRLPSSGDAPDEPVAPIRERELALDGLPLGSRDVTVVFLDRGLGSITTSMGPAKPLDLAPAQRIWYVQVRGTERLRWTANGDPERALQ